MDNQLFNSSDLGELKSRLRHTLSGFEVLYENDCRDQKSNETVYKFSSSNAFNYELNRSVSIFCGYVNMMFNLYFCPWSRSLKYLSV